MFSKSSKPFRFAKTHLNKDESPVTPNLAMTPSQMEKLHAEGKSISLNNLEGMFYDGDTNPSFELPIDQIRGVDIGEIWQASKDARRKLSKYRVTHPDVSTIKTE